MKNIQERAPASASSDWPPDARWKNMKRSEEDHKWPAGHWRRKEKNGTVKGGDLG